MSSNRIQRSVFLLSIICRRTEDELVPQIATKEGGCGRVDQGLFKQELLAERIRKLALIAPLNSSQLIDRIVQSVKQNNRVNQMRVSSFNNHISLRLPEKSQDACQPLVLSLPRIDDR